MSDFDDNKFKSVKQEWETPLELFNFLDSRFGFTVDLAADKTNNKCDIYYSKGALNKEWTGVGWLNPPYSSKESKLKDWIKKAYDETNKHRATVVMLIPARTNTNWWHNYCMKSTEIMLIRGRPKFKGCKHGLPWPLAIIVFSNNNGNPLLKSLNYKDIEKGACV